MKKLPEIIKKNNRQQKTKKNNINLKVKSDRRKLYHLFEQEGRVVPKYFKVLSNNLKDNSKIKNVFKQAAWYLNDGHSITQIKLLLKEETILKMNKKKMESELLKGKEVPIKKMPYIKIISTSMRD